MMTVPAPVSTWELLSSTPTAMESAWAWAFPLLLKEVLLSELLGKKTGSVPMLAELRALGLALAEASVVTETEPPAVMVVLPWRSA